MSESITIEDIRSALKVMACSMQSSVPVGIELSTRTVEHLRKISKPAPSDGMSPGFVGIPFIINNHADEGAKVYYSQEEWVARVKEINEQP